MTNDFNCDVLIVEDERIQCEEMAAFLARAGLSVAMAHDGATGLARPAAIRRGSPCSTTICPT